MRRQEAEKFDLRNLTGEARECLETLDSNSLVEFLLDYDADDFDTISVKRSPGISKKDARFNNGRVHC